jgi:hypothetical protein
MGFIKNNVTFIQISVMTRIVVLTDRKSISSDKGKLFK